MKKLNKSQLNELNAHVQELAQKKQEIDECWDKFVAAHEEIQNAIGEYNGVIATVTEWRDDLVQQMQDYQGERSDRWQEGDAGQAYQSWIDEWENLDLSEVETPDMPDQPEPEHMESIEQLPTEPEM